MDLFFFDDDAMRRLDSYQHFDSPDTSVFHAGSITGRKLLVAVANYGSGPSSWAGVYSYADVEARLSDIANESLDYPVLTGETRITAEAVNTPELFIIPLFSSISLESLRCDFHDKPYRGARLENIRVYLTNVRRDCGILDTASSVGTSWLNLGGLVDADMESVSSPGMFSRVLDESVGEEAVSPGVELYCYPNSPEMETMGTPVTRLVVEGTLCGKKYYYPIDLRGIGRNERYAVDLLITRTGTDSPDTPASSDMIVTLMKVLPWEEKEETVENF